MPAHRDVVEGFLRVGLIGVILAVAAPGSVEGAAGRDAADRTTSRVSPIAAAMRPARAPLGFERNEGQVDPEVRFLARCGGASLFLTGDEAVLSVGAFDSAALREATGRRGPSSAKAHPAAVLRMRYVGARPAPALRGEELQPGKSNYLLGNDPAKWRKGVARFSRVRSDDLWKGVDLLWHGEDGQAEFDFEIAPGADPGAIALAFEGAESSEIDAGGDLLLGTAAGTVRLSRPVAYEVAARGRRPVAVRFERRADGSTGFVLGRRDPALPLVIDPTLVYSTYFGGSGDEAMYLVKADVAGALYVVGLTNSTNYPTRAPMQPSSGGGTFDAIVTKINPGGTTLAYSSYLGGSGEDVSLGVTLDLNGNVYLCGSTTSTNFPVVNPIQSQNAGKIDAFVAKLDYIGSGLLYSTYYGGAENDRGFRIALDAGNAAYVAGETGSTGFPVKAALQPTYGGGTRDAFVVKFNAAGSSTVYSTFLGGSGIGFERASVIAVDGIGAAYVAGFTDSADFPVHNAIQTAYAGSTEADSWDDAFVAKLSPSGASLDYSTFLGGTGNEEAESLVLDGERSVYVVGQTTSADFPLKIPLQSVNRLGPADAFVTKIDPAGASLAYSTYLGGTGNEEGWGIGVDARGTVLVCGMTESTDFPVKVPLQATNWGYTDGFMARLNQSGTALFSSTYIGCSAYDYAYDAAPVPGGGWCVAGLTSWTDFPTASPFQAALSGVLDGFVLRLTETPPSEPTSFFAQPFTPTSVTCSWVDNSGNETGFEVQRRTGNGLFTLAGTTATNVPFFTDSNGLSPETTYTYRVCAVSGEGSSFPSEEVIVTTPAIPVPPAAPTGLAAVAGGCSTVNLSWNDNSNNEIYFDVLRMDDAGEFVSVIHRPPGSKTYSDSGRLPGATFTYRVRAVSLGGVSAFTSDAAATLPSSLVVVPKKGSLSVGTGPGKGKASMTGSFTMAACAGGGAFDPAEGGFQVCFGSEAAPVRLVIATDDPAWKSKKGKHTWKSGKGAASKWKITFDTVKGTFAVAASGLDFDPAPTNPLWFWIAPGDEGGSVLGTWREKKPGQFATP